ncbi:MAG: hypothetical protein JWQ14_3654 [Adhaeribacter sp.]|nr:hypothetical protein [Adhaeribacter sp.]
MAGGASWRLKILRPFLSHFSIFLFSGLLKPEKRKIENKKVFRWQKTFEVKWQRCYMLSILMPSLLLHFHGHGKVLTTLVTRQLP